MLRATNRASLYFQPIYGRVHFFIDKATDQYQISSYHQQSRFSDLIVFVTILCLNDSLFCVWEDEVGLVIDREESALVGSAVYSNDADDII